MKKDDGTFEAIRYKRYIPGDPSAAFKWLANRRRQNWTDTQRLEHSGSVTVNIVRFGEIEPK
jgi:hypothetical protein